MILDGITKNEPSKVTLLAALIAVRIIARGAGKATRLLRPLDIHAGAREWMNVKRSQ